MELSSSLADVLERDWALARRHDVTFGVVSRLSGSTPRDRLPERHGTFDNPSDAIAVGRTLVGRDVTVTAGGSGPYWHSSAPDKIYSRTLEIVCRDKVLGPEEARREHDRDRLRHELERLRAELHLDEAAALVSGCKTAREAEHRLEADPLQLSHLQAKHLVLNRNLQLLTAEGKRGLQFALDEAADALEQLGPSLPTDTR